MNFTNNWVSMETDSFPGEHPSENDSSQSLGYGSEWGTIRGPRMSLDSWPIGSSWVTNAFFNRSASDILIGKKRQWGLLLRQGRGQEWAVEKRVPLRMKQLWLCDLGTVASEKMSPSCHTRHRTRLTSLSLPPWPQAIPIISCSDWIFERERERVDWKSETCHISVCASERGFITSEVENPYFPGFSFFSSPFCTMRCLTITPAW